MGPTCSIVYENEPMVKNNMLQKPRKISNTFLNWKELSISIVQGIAITLAVLCSYQISVHHNGNEMHTRAMVFSTLIFSNLFLSFANRSFHYSIWQTILYKNNMLWAISSVVLLCLAAILYSPTVSIFFHVEALSIQDIKISLFIAFVGVFWFEIYKWIKRKINN
jgi:Ca2+-transporting ATPase